MKRGHRESGTLLWSSLAATIMVQIGRRGTARRLLKISEKFQKSQNLNVKILVHHFLRLCLVCIVKKIWLDSNKTDGGDTFWSLPFRQPPADGSMQQQYWRRGGVMQRQSTTDVRIHKCCVRIFPRIRTGGIRNWGRNRAVKTNRLVLTECSYRIDDDGINCDLPVFVLRCHWHSTCQLWHKHMPQCYSRWFNNTNELH